MTREEQIKVLKDWKPELELMAKYNSNSIDYQRYTALEMAIKALEQNYLNRTERSDKDEPTIHEGDHLC